MLSDAEDPKDEQAPEEPHEQPQTVFERVMNNPVAQHERRVAALVIFDRGVTEDEVQQQFDKLERVERAELREFDPGLGGYPVIYFP